MKKSDEQRGPSTSDHLPHKPTRETATGSGRIDPVIEQRDEPAGADTPEHLGTERNEVGDAQSSSRHPPHVQDQEKGMDVQGNAGGEDAPVMPANAGGQDRLTVDEQNGSIDSESMYDQRPERDKTRPPSSRVKE